MNTLQIVPGSLAEVARSNHQSIAESFVNADVVIIVDVSGSMAEKDSRGGRSRYEVALEELAQLQKALPGKIAVLAFSSDTLFIPSGQPPLLMESTNLVGALRFAKPADLPGMRFVVISDGAPDSEQDALDVARTYAEKIDTVFTGSETDTHARDFLRRLAEASGGQARTAAQVKELAQVTLKLLETK